MHRVRFLLLPALMLFAAVGLAQGQEREEREPEEDDPKARVPEYLQDYKRKGLPPIGDRIEFEDRHAFPPRPKGLRLAEGVKPDVKEISQPSIVDLIARSREVALRDERVKSALGERFALVGGGPVIPPKDQPSESARRQTTLDFYSYSRNRAFTVLLTEREVVSVTPEREGYQPPETREEVDAAAAIVRRDQRFSATVKDLSVRGIQTPSETGNRYLYLMFYKADTPPAVFEATVDMTAGRVVNAGAVRRQP